MCVDIGTYRSYMYLYVTYRSYMYIYARIHKIGPFPICICTYMCIYAHICTYMYIYAHIHIGKGPILCMRAYMRSYITNIYAAYRFFPCGLSVFAIIV